MITVTPDPRRANLAIDVPGIDATARLIFDGQRNRDRRRGLATRDPAGIAPAADANVARPFIKGLTGFDEERGNG